MKLSFVLPCDAHVFAMLLLGSCFAWGTSAFAQAARLFGVTDLVGKSVEASSLTEAERKELAGLRQHTALYKTINIVRLNRAALGSGVVSVVTPDGKEFQYTGSSGRNYDQTHLWTGKSNHGTTLIIAYDEKALHGQFQEEGKAYQFQTLAAGRAYILAERSAVVMHESPGMSGREDPPGLVPNIKPLPLPPQPSASPIAGKP